MEFLMEIVFEVYLELMMLIVPEKEVSTKKHRFFAAVLAITVLSVVLALAVWGLVLLIDCRDMRGLIPLVAAIFISAFQIGFGVYLFFKKKD